MTRLTLFCAITALSVAMVAEARAQAANPEPGYCAQFYPNADCNSIGPATPQVTAPAAESKPEEAAPPQPAPKKAAKKKKTQTSATAAPAK
jgi:hypothetical protein